MSRYIIDFRSSCLATDNLHFAFEFVSVTLSREYRKHSSTTAPIVVESASLARNRYGLPGPFIRPIEWWSAYTSIRSLSK